MSEVTQAQLIPAIKAARIEALLERAGQNITGIKLEFFMRAHGGVVECGTAKLPTPGCAKMPRVDFIVAAWRPGQSPARAFAFHTFSLN